MSLDHSFNRGPATHVVIVIVIKTGFNARPLLEKPFWSEKEANKFCKKAVDYVLNGKEKELAKWYVKKGYELKSEVRSKSNQGGEQ